MLARLGCADACAAGGASVAPWGRLPLVGWRGVRPLRGAGGARRGRLTSPPCRGGAAAPSADEWRQDAVTPFAPAVRSPAFALPHPLSFGPRSVDSGIVVPQGRNRCD